MLRIKRAAAPSGPVLTSEARFFEAKVFTYGPTSFTMFFDANFYLISFSRVTCFLEPFSILSNSNFLQGRV